MQSTLDSDLYKWSTHLRHAMGASLVCNMRGADTFEFSAFVYVNTAVTANALMYLDMLCDALRKSSIYTRASWKTLSL